MVNSTSPLQSSRRLGQFGRAGATGVTIEEVAGFGMVQIAAWGATLRQVGATAAAAAGCETPPLPGRCHVGIRASLLRVEPMKWWLIARSGAVVPTPELAPAEGAVLDMQDGRCWLRISGDRAAPLLNHFLPLDLRPAAFPVGAVASTGFHHVGVTLWRAPDHLNLLIPRSSAQSLWDLLSESARQYGLVET